MTQVRIVLPSKGEAPKGEPSSLSDWPETIENSSRQQQTKTATSKLSIPEKKPYLISSSDKELLSIVDSMSTSGLNTNILVTGPQGVGKSELVVQYAASRKRPLATLEIGNLAEASQIFGHRTLENGEIVYIKGLFTEAITTPNAVVHLQEINRPENDKALNALFSVLDDTFRKIWIDEAQRQIEVAAGVTFFASLNEGFEFIGTLPLDEALKNRFHIKLDLKPLPSNVEKSLLRIKGFMSEPQIEELMDLAVRLRSNTQEPLYISTRDLLNTGLLIKHGLSTMMAMKAVIGTEVDKLESVLLSEHLAGRGITQQEETYGLL